MLERGGCCSLPAGCAAACARGCQWKQVGRAPPKATQDAAGSRGAGPAVHCGWCRMRAPVPCDTECRHGIHGRHRDPPGRSMLVLRPTGSRSVLAHLDPFVLSQRAGKVQDTGRGDRRRARARPGPCRGRAGRAAMPSEELLAERQPAPARAAKSGLPATAGCMQLAGASHEADGGVAQRARIW